MLYGSGTTAGFNKNQTPVEPYFSAFMGIVSSFRFWSYLAVGAPILMLIDCYVEETNHYKTFASFTMLILEIASVIVLNAFVGDYNYWYKLMSLKVTHQFLHDWKATYGEMVPSIDTPVTTPPIKEIPKPDWKWADNPTG